MNRYERPQRLWTLREGDLIAVTVAEVPYVGRFRPIPFRMGFFGLRYPDGVEQRFHYNEIDDVKLLRRRSFPGAGMEVESCQ